MSRGLAEAERCSARELLGASVGLRELTDQARIAMQLVVDLKSAEDRSTAVKYLGRAAHRVVEMADDDLLLVNELLARISTPSAKEQAIIIRGQMMELRALWKPYATEKW